MRLRLFLILLLIPFACFSQKQANIWYFGQNAGLDFNSGSPVPLLDGALNTNEGCASISDSDGNLLFYTDGITVYNRNHTLLENGNGLTGDPSSTHSAIIVPKPEDPDIYYIFTVDATAQSDGLKYSEVDMTLDGGLGGITVNKNVLLDTPTTEKITAIQSSVANEYWVVSHRWESDEFIAYNVSDLGINTTPVVSAVGSVIENDVANTIGQMKISPDGTLLATTQWTFQEVQLFDFDAATGVVSNPRTIVDPTDFGTAIPIYGLEFSSNSRVLYGSVNAGYIYQWDLEAGSEADIRNSRIQLSLATSLYGSLQLATDEKFILLNSQQLLMSSTIQTN